MASISRGEIFHETRAREREREREQDCISRRPRGLWTSLIRSGLNYFKLSFSLSFCAATLHGLPRRELEGQPEYKIKNSFSKYMNGSGFVYITPFFHPSVRALAFISCISIYMCILGDFALSFASLVTLQHMHGIFQKGFNIQWIYKPNFVFFLHGRASCDYSNG